MLRLAAILFPCLTLVSAIAEEPKDPNNTPARLLSFDDLQRRLDDPGLRLLDVRSKEDYDQGHIPGALWVDADAVEKLAARPGGLANTSAWEAWVVGLGLKPGIEVVVYDDNRQRDAARFWWLLGYLGVDKVALVDGGFPLWKKEGRPVSLDAPVIAPAGFSVAYRRERLATKDDVLANLTSKSARIVDARSGLEFTGDDKRAERGGRVPGACHIEWAELVDKDGRFLPTDTLRAKLREAGLTEGNEPVITHCQSGGRASVDAFVMERLGHPTRNYYLGWSDWGNNDDLPIETGGNETN